MKSLTQTVIAKLGQGVIITAVLLANVTTAQALPIISFQSDCETSPFFTEVNTTASISTEAVSAVSDIEYASDC